MTAPAKRTHWPIGKTHGILTSDRPRAVWFLGMAPCPFANIDLLWLIWLRRGQGEDSARQGGADGNCTPSTVIRHGRRQSFATCKIAGIVVCVLAGDRS